MSLTEWMDQDRVRPRFFVMGWRCNAWSVSCPCLLGVYLLCAQLCWNNAALSDLWMNCEVPQNKQTAVFKLWQLAAGTDAGAAASGKNNFKTFSFFSQCAGVSAEEPAPGCCTLHDIWSNKDSLLLWLLPLLLSRHYSPNKWINLTLPLLLLVASRRKAEKIRLSLWQCFQQWNHLEMLRGG